MRKLEIKTEKRTQLVDITARVSEAVRDAGLGEGVVHLWSLHTTCGLTVNEGADPDVARDIGAKLDQVAPKDESFYRHAEGNSDSHVKTSLVGPGVTLLVSDGQVVLGRWQAVFLAEFDGPRTRTVALQTVATGD